MNFVLNSLIEKNGQLPTKILHQLKITVQEMSMLDQLEEMGFPHDIAYVSIIFKKIPHR